MLATDLMPFRFQNMLEPVLYRTLASVPPIILRQVLYLILTYGILLVLLPIYMVTISRPVGTPLKVFLHYISMVMVMHVGFRPSLSI